jgi:hypothetical protein
MSGSVWAIAVHAAMLADSFVFAVLVSHLWGSELSLIFLLTRGD